MDGYHILLRLLGSKNEEENLSSSIEKAFLEACLPAGNPLSHNIHSSMMDGWHFFLHEI
jgi:hypothetical protein